MLVGVEDASRNVRRVPNLLAFDERLANQNSVTRLRQAFTLERLAEAFGLDTVADE